MSKLAKTRHMADPGGNHFLNRVAEKGTTGHGRAFEDRVIPGLGARAQPASGAMAHAKGDAKLSTKKALFLLELKATTAASITVQLSWLVKITEESLALGRQPALVIGFVTPEGKPRPMPRTQSEWVMIPRVLFEELTDGD